MQPLTLTFHPQDSMSKQPNYSMDRRERDRAKQAKKATKAEEKAAAKRDAASGQVVPPAPAKAPS